MKHKENPVTGLSIFTFEVLALGGIVALLLHYADYGWNPGTATWAKVAVFVSAVVLAAAAASRFVETARQLKAVSEAG